MSNRNVSKQVSFRLPQTEYDQLQASADRANQTISELARTKITSSNRTETLQDELRQLEARLTKKLFLLNCAISGLDKDGVKAASQLYDQLLNERRQ